MIAETTASELAVWGFWLALAGLLWHIAAFILKRIVAKKSGAVHVSIEATKAAVLRDIAKAGETATTAIETAGERQAAAIGGVGDVISGELRRQREEDRDKHEGGFSLKLEKKKQTENNRPGRITLTITRTGTRQVGIKGFLMFVNGNSYNVSPDTIFDATGPKELPKTFNDGEEESYMINALTIVSKFKAKLPEGDFQAAFTAIPTLADVEIPLSNELTFNADDI